MFSRTRTRKDRRSSDACTTRRKGQDTWTMADALATLPDRIRRCGARASDPVAEGTAQYLEAVLNRMPELWGDWAGSYFSRNSRAEPRAVGIRPTDLNSKRSGQPLQEKSEAG